MNVTIPTRRLRSWPPAALAALCLLLVTTVATAADLQTARDAWQQGTLRDAVEELRAVLAEQPTDPEALVMMARLYLDYGNGAAAAGFLEAAMERARPPVPRSELRAELAEALLLQGEPTRVLDEIDVDDVRNDEEWSRLLTLRARALRQLDMPEEAARELALALRLAPDSVHALIEQAEQAIAHRNPERGREQIEAALAVDPASPLALERLGDLEYVLGNHAAAETAFTKAIAVARNRWAIAYKRALARLDQQQLDAAEADLVLVRREYPDFAGLPYANGLLAFHRGELEAALAGFEAVLGRNPSHPQSIYYAGMALYGLGRFRQAEEYASRLVNAMPGHQQAALLLARARIANGRHREAIAILRPLAEADDAAGESLALYGTALAGAGELGDAGAVLRRAAQTAPDNSSVRLALARVLLGAGETDRAAAELERLLARAPEHRLARLQLFKLYLEAGDGPRALEQADKLGEQAPEDPSALNALGLALQANGRTDEARAAFEAALDADPEYANAALALANMAVAAGDRQTARRYLEQVLAAQPTHSDAITGLAALDDSDGNRPLALMRLRNALEANPRDLSIRLQLARGLYVAQDYAEAQQVLDLTPPELADHPTLLLAKVEVSLALGRPFNAATQMGRLLELNPDAADNHFRMAIIQATLGNLAAVEQHLLRAAELDPSSPLAGDAYRAGLESHPDSAGKQALLSKLEAISPNDAMIRAAQAELSLEQGDYGEALEELREAYRQNQDDPQLLAQLYDAQRRAGQDHQALGILKDWIRRYPGDVAARILLAQQLEQMGRPAEAIEVYQEALVIAPRNPVVLNNLAWLLRDSAPARALGYAEGAYTIDQDPSIGDTLGTILLERGATDRAAEILEQAYADSPTNASTGFRYAKALAAQGQKQRAAAILQAILLQSFPEKPDAEDLLREMQ